MDFKNIIRNLLNPSTYSLNEGQNITSLFLTFKFIKFILLGLFTWLSALVQMYLYTEILKMPNGIAYAITLVVIFVSNFFLARIWVFASTEGNPYTQGTRFLIAVVLFRFVNWGIFMILNYTLDLHKYVAVVFAMSLVIPLKYIVYHNNVFTKS